MVFETFEGVDLLMMGSMEPLSIDLRDFQRQMDELQVSMDLRRVHIREPIDVLNLFRLGTAEVNSLVEGAPRNTDDNARVEFAAPKALYVNNLAENVEFLDNHASDFMAYVYPAPATPEEHDRLLLDTAWAWHRRGFPEYASALAKRCLEGPLADEAQKVIDAENNEESP
jgi:hypothetical protein